MLLTCLCNIFSSDLLQTKNWLFFFRSASNGWNINIIHNIERLIPNKSNLGSEGVQLVGNMLMRPTRGEPVGPVAKGEKGRGGHWAAFGTRLRLSCLGLHSVDLLIYSKVSIACVGGLVSWGLPASSSGGINGPAGLLLLLGTHPGGGPPTPTPAGV